MNAILQHGILWAQQSRLDGLASRFQGRGSQIDMADVLTGLAILAGIVVAIWLLSHLLSWQDRRKAFSHGGLLFLALCRAHALRWSERWLLWRLARSQHLGDPARLFVEPRCFDPSRLAPALRLRAEQLAELRERLFAGLEEAAEAEDESPAAEARDVPSPDGGATAAPLPPSPPGSLLDAPPWAPVANRH